MDIMTLSNRNVIVAIDDSENAEFAFDCEYIDLFTFFPVFILS